jgi:hypothetical protein
VPRAHWPLGRVLRVNTAEDGLVRSVQMKTARSEEVVRPIHKICLLEAAYDDAKDFD